MAFDMVKFDRGQVWFIKNKNTIDTPAGHEQLKDRPWLILSVGKFNHSSGMVTCVPITSRDRVVSPAQVLFKNTYNEPNIILCEQIKTIDIKSGNYDFNYMGTLSDDIMEAVDSALTIHLGLHYSPITLKKLYDSMESIVKSVAKQYDLNKTSKFTDDDIIDFAARLESLALVEKETPEVIDKSQYETNSPSTKSSDLIASDGVEPSNKPTTPVKSERIKWTKEKCEEFIKDCETLPMKKVMEKWSISKKTKYYSMKHYAQSIMDTMKD